MRPEFITVGTVVNAHGVRGEVKVNPAGFDPAFIAAFRTLYIGGVETKVAAARVHKSTVLLTLPGGREYLVQVPGVMNSGLSDADTARLMNWLLPQVSAETLPPGTLPYDAAEIARLGVA